MILRTPHINHGMLNAREPTGAPLMNPNSNGATRRPVLYYNMWQYVNDLEKATYRVAKTHRMP